METVLNTILNTLAAMVTPGVTTKYLDEQAERLCSLLKVEPAFKGYKPTGFGTPEGYPNALCVSINEEVIHGIPSDRKIQQGDVVKLDIGTREKEVCDCVFIEGKPCSNCNDAGFTYKYDDGATTVLVGEVEVDKHGNKTGRILGTSAVARKLIKATKEALDAGVAQAKAGKTTHDIASAIEAVAKKYDMHVVHGYGGHGIGKELHMEPHVPNEIAGAAPPVELKRGMRIAIEPMFGSNHGFTQVAKDGWTVKLRNGGLAAHFEQTVTIQ